MTKMDYIRTNMNAILYSSRNIPFGIFRHEEVHDDWMDGLRTACRNCDLAGIKRLLDDADKLSDKFLDGGGDTSAYIRASSTLGIMEQTYWHAVDHAKTEAYKALMHLVEEHHGDTKTAIQVFSIGSKVLKGKFREASLRIDTRIEKNQHEKPRDEELLARAKGMLVLIKHAET